MNTDMNEYLDGERDFDELSSESQAEAEGWERLTRELRSDEEVAAPVWMENAEEAHAANLIDLAIWKDPTSVVRMEFEADSDVYRMAAALRLTLSDRITVKESSYYGISEDFYIENIRRALSPRTTSAGIRADRMVVSYDLSPAKGFSDFFIWGFSKWGESTKAARS